MPKSQLAKGAKECSRQHQQVSSPARHFDPGSFGTDNETQQADEHRRGVAVGME